MSAANGEAKKTLVRALHDKYSIDEDTEIKIHVRIPKGAPGYSGRWWLEMTTRC